MPPAARPHKLQATLRSAYVRLSQSRGAKLALLEPHAIPRPAASGRSRPFRCSSSPNCKRFAGLQFGSICLARKSRQKDALGDALYCALTRAIFWPLRGLNALFGRKADTFPIAYGSGKCTTRICGQTASISVLLISGILGQFRSCTAPCRGRCGHRPLQRFTVERKYSAPPANS